MRNGLTTVKRLGWKQILNCEIEEAAAALKAPPPNPRSLPIFSVVAIRYTSCVDASHATYYH